MLCETQRVFRVNSLSHSAFDVYNVKWNISFHNLFNMEEDFVKIKMDLLSSTVFLFLHVLSFKFIFQTYSL